MLPLVLAHALSSAPASAEPAPSSAPPTAAAPTTPPVEGAQTEPEPTPDAKQPEPAAPAAEPAPEPKAVPTPVVVAEVATTAEPAAKPEEKSDPNDIEKLRYVPGKGVEFVSKDGRFSLQLRARLQVRYDLEHPNLEGEKTEQIFQIRRARLQFQGNVFGKHNRYYIQLGMSPRDQTGGLLAEDGSIRRNVVRDARLEFDYLRDFTIWVGQMKIPFSRQRVISSGNLNMVDRSIANEEFNLDRDIGIQALSKDIGGLGKLKYNVGVFIGEGRNNFEPSDFGMLYVGKLEYMPLGEYDDYSEGDLERSEKPGMSVAAAYAFHDEAPGDRGPHGSIPEDGGDTDIHNVTAELHFKWRGASLQSAFHWRKGVNRVNGGALDEEGNLFDTALPRNGLGWFGQLGYLVPKIPFEVVARYGFARRPDAQTSALPWRDELGGGINYYFADHNLKLQLDYFRLWGLDTGPTVSSAMKNGTDRIRLQVQLAF